MQMIRKFSLLAAAAGAALLAGCSSVDLNQPTAPVTDLSTYSQGQGTAPASTATGTTHTVAAGETLYKIARSYGVSPRDIQQANGITDPTQLRIGQVLTIPGAAANNTAAYDAPASSEVRVTPVNAYADALPEQSSAAAEETQAKADEAKAKADAEKAKAEEEKAKLEEQKAKAEETAAAAAAPAKNARMIWPAEGKILSSFKQNKMGLDIGGVKGDVVVAAADGEVIFIGNQVASYGNLVIVKHSPTLVTAYAHNDKVTVKLHQKVKAGQKIAEIGSTGASQPMLRFEVRDKGRPVDPAGYLPQR
ncbi:MAG: Peptidoglycan DD-metalloendopeptidase family protein [Burkholderia sp.]|jgi:lipoprotein NlpD